MKPLLGEIRRSVTNLLQDQLRLLIGPIVEYLHEYIRVTAGQRSAKEVRKDRYDIDGECHDQIGSPELESVSPISLLMTTVRAATSVRSIASGR